MESWKKSEEVGKSYDLQSKFKKELCLVGKSYNVKFKLEQHPLKSQEKLA